MSLIQSIQVKYGAVWATKWGTSSGELKTLLLDPDEYVISVNATAGRYTHSLTFVTNKRTVEPYGRPGIGTKTTCNTHGLGKLSYISVLRGSIVDGLKLHFERV